MRLSDVKGEKTFDVIADVIEPIARMAGDKKLAGLFKIEKAAAGVDPREIAKKRLKENLPYMLKAHKREMIAIMAAIEGKEAAEYERELNLLKLIKDCSELLTDGAFIALFPSAQSRSSSGSAPESSEAEV